MLPTWPGLRGLKPQNPTGRASRTHQLAEKEMKHPIKMTLMSSLWGARRVVKITAGSALVGSVAFGAAFALAEPQAIVLAKGVGAFVGPLLVWTFAPKWLI